MKLKLLPIFLIATTLFSCSSSDDGGSSDNGDSTPTNYMPLTINNYWTYDVENQGTLSGRDSIFISNDTLINQVVHKKIKTLNTPNGFYSITLRNNGVKINGSSLVVSGTFNAPIPGLQNPITVNLNQFTFFKENSMNNDIISQTPTYVTTQTVQGLPDTIDIKYDLRSIAGETLPTYTSPNGDVYSNVKVSKIILSVEAHSTTMLFNQPLFRILDKQDLVISTQYYAKNIGNVFTNTDINYVLNSTIANQFGIPATGSQNQKEYLDTYIAN